MQTIIPGHYLKHSIQKYERVLCFLGISSFKSTLVLTSQLQECSDVQVYVFLLKAGNGNAFTFELFHRLTGSTHYPHARSLIHLDRVLSHCLLFRFIRFILRCSFVENVRIVGMIVVSTRGVINYNQGRKSQFWRVYLNLTPKKELTSSVFVEVSLLFTQR